MLSGSSILNIPQTKRGNFWRTRRLSVLLSWLGVETGAKGKNEIEKRQELSHDENMAWNEENQGFHSLYFASIHKEKGNDQILLKPSCPGWRMVQRNLEGCPTKWPHFIFLASPFHRTFLSVHFCLADEGTETQKRNMMYPNSLRH